MAQKQIVILGGGTGGTMTALAAQGHRVVLVTATGGELVRVGAVVDYHGVTTDTRALEPGELFVAIRGDTVYTMACAPVRDGVVLVRDGKIESVGPGSQVKVPGGQWRRDSPRCRAHRRFGQSNHARPGRLPQPHRGGRRSRFERSVAARRANSRFHQRP